jgi:hypothetical protein
MPSALWRGGVRRLVPGGACDLHCHPSPSQGIPTSLCGVLRTSAARLIPVTCIPPSPRQHSRELSSRPWLLGESHSVARPVDTSSSLRAIRDYSVPHLCLLWNVGPHSSPGFSAVPLSRLQTRPGLICAFWPWPITCVGYSHVTTSQHGFSRSLSIGSSARRGSRSDSE